MLQKTVKGYNEAASKADPSLFCVDLCIFYELLIDPLFMQVCSYSAFLLALNQYNTLTMRLNHAIERLEGLSIL